MLDTIREFGAGWLHRLGEERVLRRCHRDYYLALAQRADAAWIGPGQIAWYERTRAEYANLRAVLDFCLAEQTWHTLGTPQMGSPQLIAARQACEKQARHLIGDAAYETAFRAGYDTDTAITYALHTPDAASPHAAVD
ncbi:hypothetical protein C3486_32255 [Streptomyces sp. Ru73]|uniref:hypothetical protein n=1 Tax=Streptomyces sp. Ru73 TaxID=2080748 RepID=UPI000CDE367B|nr:hypothetical protein [Streptomyces sp. Ru73]POX36684.1 hypothetical protein C3486_32255 [Streptomyces sp. Ru73]